MYIQLSISEIKREHLSDECLSAISKFAKTLINIEGKSIDIYDTYVVKSVVMHAKLSSNVLVRLAYKEFKNALTTHLQKHRSSIQKSVINLSATQQLNNNPHLTRDLLLESTK